ncbi:hypothetical protein FHV99_001582 [Ochrobactrum sp. P20RRXII]|nr:hypothetical protein [Ochrobactrum sp. P20RRXII]
MVKGGRSIGLPLARAGSVGSRFLRAIIEGWGDIKKANLM